MKLLAHYCKNCGAPVLASRHLRSVKRSRCEAERDEDLEPQA